MRDLHISLFDRAADNEPKGGVISWPMLSEALTSHEARASKDGPAWSPCEFLPGKPRRTEFTVQVHAMVLDLDGEVSDKLWADLEGGEYVAHTTHSGGWRVVMPLAKPCPAHVWPDVWRAIEGVLKSGADSKCTDAPRLYYFPSHPEGAQGETKRGEGAWLDWEKFLTAPVPPAPSPVERATEPTTVAYYQGPFDVWEYRAQLKRVRTPSSQGAIEKILTPLPLAEHGGRQVAVHQAASIVGFALKPPPTPEFVAEFMRPCIEAMPCAPEGVDYWVNQAVISYRQAVQSKASKSRGPPRPMREARETPKAKSAKDANEWKARLLVRQDGEAGSVVRPLGSNVHTILDQDPRWAGKLQFNALTKDIELREDIQGVDPKYLGVTTMNWLEREFNVSVPSYRVEEQLLAVARLYTYDPLHEYLTQLQWDHIPRLEIFFSRYCGAESCEANSVIGKRWFISAVKRAMEPGCKVDTVLVLNGDQGARKSSMIRALGTPWSHDTKLNLGDKDSRSIAGKTWLIEMPELESWRGKDMDELKAFFSQQEDRFRPPYGRTEEVSYRRSVFIGTTNKLQVLSDETGARRFWPVQVGPEIDLDAVKRDRDQLWAEAMYLYEAGEQCFLTRAEEKLLQPLREEREEDIPFRDQIAEWWETLKVKPESVSAKEVGAQLGFDGKDIDSARLRVLGKALRSLGFSVRKVGKYHVSRWFPPPELAGIHVVGSNFEHENRDTTQDANREAELKAR